MSDDSDSLERNFKPGDFLFKEGDVGQEMYVLQSGYVTIFRDEDGERVELSEVTKGSIIGEMALFDNKPRSASAVAKTNIRVIKVSKNNFQKQLTKMPRWLGSIVEIIIKRLREANKKIHNQEIEDYASRIAQILQYLFSIKDQKTGNNVIKLELANNHIGSMLSLQPEEISPAYKDLSNKGYIKIDGGEITLKDQKNFSLYIQMEQGIGEEEDVDISPDDIEIINLLIKIFEKNNNQMAGLTIIVKEFNVGAKGKIDEAKLKEFVEKGIIESNKTENEDQVYFNLNLELLNKILESKK